MAITGKRRVGVSTPARGSKGGRDGYQVNLSEDERELIDRGAALAGLDRSAFMRSEAVKAARLLIGQTGGGA